MLIILLYVLGDLILIWTKWSKVCVREFITHSLSVTGFKNKCILYVWELGSSYIIITFVASFYDSLATDTMSLNPGMAYEEFQLHLRDLSRRELDDPICTSGNTPPQTYFC